MTVHELRRPVSDVCVLVTRRDRGFVASIDDAVGLDAVRDAELDEMRAQDIDSLMRQVAERLKKHWRIK